MRWIERNSDYQKMCLMGMPEFHIDPTKNRWRRGEWAACGPARWWKTMEGACFNLFLRTWRDLPCKSQS
jgi:hypothetical protein